MGFEEEGLMLIRITRRNNCSARWQGVGSKGFIVPSREDADASYTVTNQHFRMLCGSV